jgi:hypothetical protein
MLLLLVLLLHVVTPVSAIVQSVSFIPSGPLEWTVSWVEEANVVQGYILTIRDSLARKSYTRTIPSGQNSIYLDSASASGFSLSTGEIFAGLIATTEYIIQVYTNPQLLKYLICVDI